MTKLEAINMILRRLGEATVTSLDVPYPTVSVALPALEEARNALLLDEWFFNKFQWENLLPNNLGRVEVPQGILAVYPENVDKYVYTGRYIRDAQTGRHVNEPVKCRTVIDIPFEDLPPVAQYYIVYQAAYNTYIQDFGADDSAQSIRQDVAAAYTNLSAQHTRQRQYSVRRKPVWQRYLGGLRN